MILPMLRAVMTMLSTDNLPTPEQLACARAVLQEIIKHLEEGPVPQTNYVDSDLDEEAQGIQTELKGD